MKKAEEKVIRFISDNELISPGDKILVALSGGSDSVFLLYFLKKFTNKYKTKLAALHVNHMIRGKNADEDEEFCRDICKSFRIEFHSVRKKVKLYAAKNKMSVEEAGRTLRYKLLNEKAAELNFDTIATAHNKSDNTETVLLNLIKGAGLKGLSGIPAKRGNIIRPVLALTKDEINSYLVKQKILFRIDESNLNDDYERNYIRNNIIPLIKERLNPAFDDVVFNSSALIKRYYQQLRKQVENLLPAAVSRGGNITSFNVGVLKETDDIISSELIKTIIERNFSVTLSFKDIAAVSGLIFSSRGEKINLLSGLKASREKHSLVVYREAERFSPAEVKINKNIKLNDKSLYISEAEKSSFTSSKPGVEYISADDLDDTFLIREWKEGDRFLPFGMKGTKKVSDFLNERKIESYVKHKQLVLTNRNRIVWVIGLRLDERFRITGNTKRVLKLCLK